MIDQFDWSIHKDTHKDAKKAAKPIIEGFRMVQNQK